MSKTERDVGGRPPGDAPGTQGQVGAREGSRSLGRVYTGAFTGQALCWSPRSPDPSVNACSLCWVSAKGVGVRQAPSRLYV